MPPCAVDMRFTPDFREVPNLRRTRCCPDWYDANLHPWIISQYSTDREPAFDFRTNRDVRACQDIRHPYAITIKQLIYHFGHRISAAQDIRRVATDALFVPTARGVFLDKIGKTLDVDRRVRVDLDDTELFGFAGQTPVPTPFGTQAFSPVPRPTGYYEDDLDDHLFRRLINAVAWSYRVRASGYFANRVYQVAVGTHGTNPILVIDYGDMHIRILYMWPAVPLERAIIAKIDPYIRPMGVGASTYRLPPVDTTFGFDGSELQPWGQGTFCTERVRFLTDPSVNFDDGKIFGFYGSGLSGFASGKLPANTRNLFAGTFNTAGRMGLR